MPGFCHNVVLMPEDIDGVWVASTVAALFPFWGLLGAHKIGDPPLTERFVALVYRRAGGYGLAGLPLLTIGVGYVYISLINEARAAWRRA